VWKVLALPNANADANAAIATPSSAATAASPMAAAMIR